MPNRLDIDQLFGNTPEPKQTPRPNPVQDFSGQVSGSAPQTAAPFNFQSLLIGVLLGVVLMFLYQRGPAPEPGPGPSPDPTPDNVIDITVDKPTVLLKFDDKMNASDGQWGVVNGTKLQTWCEGKSVIYRRYDKDDDMIKVEPIFGRLMEVAADVPSITVASTDGTITVPLPDTVEACQDVISKHTGI